MLGQYTAVRAEIVDLTELSVHADQSELLDWLRGATAPPEIVYTVHGEPAASSALRFAIETKLGLAAVVPRDLECVRIARSG
jgi:metallo-beta-lactamase family protein